MRIGCISADILAVKADMVVVSLFEGAKRPAGATAAVDAAIGGAIAAALRDGDFAGKLGETLSLRPAWATFSAVVFRPPFFPRLRFRRFFPRASCRFSSARTENGSETLRVGEPPNRRSKSAIR